MRQVVPHLVALAALLPTAALAAEAAKYGQLGMSTLAKAVIRPMSASRQ